MGLNSRGVLVLDKWANFDFVRSGNLLSTLFALLCSFLFLNFVCSSTSVHFCFKDIFVRPDLLVLASCALFVRPDLLVLAYCDLFVRNQILTSNLVNLALKVSTSIANLFLIFIISAERRKILLNKIVQLIL